MINILFAGDLVPPETPHCIYHEGLINVLSEKDFSIVNLETPLTFADNPILKTGNNFKRSPEAISHVKAGSFDAVALSNNHIRDYGAQGVIDTLNICNKNGIKTVGAGKNLEDASCPLRIEIKGKKISILNYSEREFNSASSRLAGANPYDNINAYYDIQREKTINDYVIVIYHGGLEYHYYPTIDMVRKFKYMADIGADAVVSHHTHRYSGYINYHDKPLLFGLGNFLSDSSSRNLDGWLDGLIAKLTLTENRIDVSFIPITMQKGFKFVEASAKSQKILKHIKEISTNIQQPDFLEKHWEEEYAKDAKRLITLLKSYNKNHYRLMKYFPFLISGRLNRYKSNILLNCLRCDSHREKLIKILEK